MPEPISSDPAIVDRRAFLRRGLGLGAAALAIGPLTAAAQEPAPLRVRVWCEGTAPRSVYPEDIDGAVAEILAARPGFQVARARLDDPQAGLSDEALDATDLLIWWGRLRHDDLPEDRAEAVVRRVKDGKLGFVALFGSYASRPFRGLMGMACEPGAWRDAGMGERVEVAAPMHPIARDVAPFTLPRSELFAEPFRVPEPSAVVLISTWASGETFRSGLAWQVGKGRVAYLRHADDAFPVLFHPPVRQLLANAALWASARA